jgi:arylsulfatase A-like enzyme
MKGRPRRIAVLACTVGGLAAGAVDVGYALAAGATEEAHTAAALLFVAAALIGGCGAIAGLLLAGAGWAIGAERRDLFVRLLSGKPRGALSRIVLATLAGSALAIGMGALLARSAFEAHSPAAAALGVGASLALGLLTAAGAHRALRRLALPSPAWVLVPVAALGALALALCLMDGGPLEAMSGRAPWSLFAAAASATAIALWRARGQGRPASRARLALWAGLSAALAGSAAVALLFFGADPEVRAASERTFAGKILDGVLGALARAPRLAALERVAALAPAPAPPSAAPVSDGPPRPSKPEAKRRPHHIVLLTVDALRADHLGAYGYRRPVSPEIDALARRATLFERAYAQETKTKGSIPSLFASRYPSDIHWGGARYLPLGDGEVMLAEHLAKAGYHTAAFVTHTYFLSNYRLNRGFAHYDTALVSTDPEVAFGRPSSNLLADRVIDYLGKVPKGRPFFLWAHFFDPHHRYLLHPGFSKFGSGPRGRYDGEVAFTDHHIGRVLRSLARHPEADRIAVLLTADHGEAFGEHGHYFHGTTLYEEEIRVPMLLSVSGMGSRRVRTPVSLLDVAPTLFELAGLPRDPRHRGRSLLGAARGERLPMEPVFAEILPENSLRTQIAVVKGDWKLIYDEVSGVLRLFHLLEDPRERNNRRRQEPLVLQELSSDLLRWRARPVPATVTPLTAERGGTQVLPFR